MHLDSLLGKPLITFFMPASGPLQQWFPAGNDERQKALRFGRKMLNAAPPLRLENLERIHKTATLIAQQA